uniref:Uncharacterized protein n=1 Tax=Anguilla anguilla TaxID=7936 RepID=A0A0E9U373_ANGAN
MKYSSRHMENLLKRLLWRKNFTLHAKRRENKCLK